MFPLFSFIGDLDMAVQLLSNQIGELGQAMSRMGVSADEMISAIKRMNEVLSRLQYHSEEITAIKDDLHDLRYEAENTYRELSNRATVTEMELSDLRSALDVKPENPNQKSDLEIFSWIVPSDEFLKLEGNMFLN
jgi:predicted nuclease with TOPRIM domain